MRANYWLFKSEPSAWSWENQCRDGVAEWDGVRNHQANKNMKDMRLKDKGFFYHSVSEKQIVGIVEIVKEWYLDPSDGKGIFGMVDVKAIKSMPMPVTLDAIKAHGELSHLALVRQGRLSVMPIDARAWQILCRMGGLDE